MFILEILPTENMLFIHKWGISFYYKNTWVSCSAFDNIETNVFLRGFFLSEMQESREICSVKEVATHWCWAWYLNQGETLDQVAENRKCRKETYFPWPMYWSNSMSPFIPFEVQLPSYALPFSRLALVALTPFAWLERIYIVIGSPEDTADCWSHTCLFMLETFNVWVFSLNQFFRFLLIFRQACRNLVFLISLSFSPTGLKLTNKSQHPKENKQRLQFQKSVRKPALKL